MKKEKPTGLTFIPHSKPMLGQEEIEAASAVIASGFISEGEVARKFEKSFAGHFGFKHAISASSGTAALHLTLAAMDIGAGDEVIVPSYVCTALLNAVHLVGAVPVPVDIDPITYNLDPGVVRKHLTAKTAAIVVPHMFGKVAEIEMLQDLDVPLIEDCAQSIGATYRQQPAGSFGAAAIFSFYATKMMATGEGGMITTALPGLADRVNDLKAYDKRDDYELRYNYKLTDIQAALGRVQLTRLDGFVSRRRQIAQCYHDALRSLDIDIPVVDDEHVFFRYVIGLGADASAWIRKMQSKGIGCDRPVFRPLHVYLNLNGFPHTEKAWLETISIPIYPALTDEEVERIIEAFLDTYQELH